jgi:hypothetical protein
MQQQLDNLLKEKDTIRFPVGICFTKTDFDRWHSLKKALLKYNKNAKISEFARKTLVEMMTDLEKLLADKNKKSKS